MDEARARIYDDLRGLVEGELNFEPLDRAPYAIDSSLYEIDPLGVVLPRSEHDVVNVVRYAAENRIAVHVRGAGTDSGGGALGRGLVVDLSRHLRQVISIGGDHVVVEAGVVLDALNAQLARAGRRLEPVTHNSDVMTVGGMIAVDAAGPRSIKFGSSGDQVDRLRVVFARGEVADVGFEPWPAYDSDPVDFKELVVRKLQMIFRNSESRLAKLCSPKRRDRAGYGLYRAASEEGIHLGRLLAGSEGTLGVTLQAVLKTVPLAAARGALLLAFSGLLDAAAFAGQIVKRGLDLASCDLFDRRALSLARDADVSLRGWIDESAEAILTVEFEGDCPGSIATILGQVRETAARSGTLVSEPVAALEQSECNRLLGLRRLVEPLLMRSRGRARPVSIVDDVAVPPEELVVVLSRLQGLLQQQNVTWTLDACAGDGRLRLRPFLDLSDPGDRARLEPLATGVYDIVLEAGGTIGSSQACGLARTQFLRKQFGELSQVFREIKDAFDPLGQLNPGKVIGDDPHLLLKDLKPWPAQEPRSTAAPEPATPVSWASGEIRAELAAGTTDASSSSKATEAGEIVAPLDETVIEPALRWPVLSLVETAANCQGCGTCRSLEPTARMCPSFRALRHEAASPRAQANLVRDIATGRLDPRLWGTDEFKAHADLCIHCKLCRSECPSAVDVSSLMLEAKAAYVEKHGLPPHDWVFSRIEFWAALASRFPIITNFLLGRRTSRWLLERMLGVSRHRVLPRVSRSSFTRRAARLGLDKPRPQLSGPRVVYFVDVYANYYDQELADSVVKVLRHAEVNVFVPSRQRSSGMAALLVGDVEHAREAAIANLRVLANAVRDGYTVICSEPTAALMLQQEYVKLTEDLDAELVASNTMDVGQYLLGLEGRGQLPKVQQKLEARVGYHQPCHLRAMGAGTPGLELLRNVLSLDVEFINRGCSGMGGTHGLSRERFWSSLRAGRGLMNRLREPDIEIGATECGACRIQMEQGATKRTLHPVKLLALGYGLNPGLLERYKDPKPRHVVS